MLYMLCAVIDSSSAGEPSGGNPAIANRRRHHLDSFAFASACHRQGPSHEQPPAAAMSSRVPAESVYLNSANQACAT